MKSRIYRPALVAICAAVLAGFAPGAALAASPVTTTPASNVTATTATLNGVIASGGLPAVWQFQFGTSTAYGQNTTIGTIAAGPPSTTAAVSANLTGLQPNKTYHFRIAVQFLLIVPTAPYYYLLPAVGADVTFNTAKVGTLTLLHTRITVKKRKAGIALKCTSVATCAGKFSASAKLKGKTVTCFSASYKIAAGKSKTATVKVSKTCDPLFKRFKKGVKMTFKTKSTSGQPNLKKTITVVKK